MLNFCDFFIGKHHFLFTWDNSPDTMLILPEVLDDIAADPELPEFDFRHASDLLSNAEKRHKQRN